MRHCIVPRHASCICNQREVRNEHSNLGERHRGVIACTCWRVLACDCWTLHCSSKLLSREDPEERVPSQFWTLARPWFALYMSSSLQALPASVLQGFVSPYCLVCFTTPWSIVTAQESTASRTILEESGAWPERSSALMRPD